MAKELIQPGDISGKSVFGAYTQKENRATAALLHLINIGGEPLLHWLFDFLPDSSISVKTQVGHEDGNAPKSIYDGIVSCGFKFELIIESKIVKNAINVNQLQKYKDYAKNNDATLIYITPDDKKPSVLGDTYWRNWTTIANRLKEYEDENTLLQYLIEQFILLLSNLELYEDWKGRVLIVGGSYGESVALKYHLYICLNHRNFKKCEYLAFSFNHQIKTLFKIKGDPQNDVDLRTLPELTGTDYFVNIEPSYSGELREVIFLEETNLLGSKTIVNDKKTPDGKRVAFTQRQAYTTYDKIIRANYTSEL